MDVVVLVKQVPDTESLIQINEDGIGLKTHDVKWVMNPYDELGVEAALRIKEAKGGTVTILSFGPEKSVETIRTALAMGADQGIHIFDELAAGSDALAIGKLLAAALKTLSYDLILTGKRAVDEDNYQVGATVAELLDLPQHTQVTDISVEDGKVTCHRVVDGGTVMVESALPALVTTERGLNEPRYASLPGIMKAKKKPINTLSLDDLGIDADSVGNAGRKVKVNALNFPPAREAVKMISGETPAEMAANLVKVLHEDVKVI